MHVKHLCTAGANTQGTEYAVFPTGLAHRFRDTTISRIRYVRTLWECIKKRMQHMLVILLKEEKNTIAYGVTIFLTRNQSISLRLYRAKRRSGVASSGIFRPWPERNTFTKIKHIVTVLLRVRFYTLDVNNGH